MSVVSDTQTGPPSILDHDLQQYFSELLKFESTPEMEASELYKKIRPEVERILNAVVVSEPPAIAGGVFHHSAPEENPAGETLPLPRKKGRHG